MYRGKVVNGGVWPHRGKDRILEARLFKRYPREILKKNSSHHQKKGGLKTTKKAESPG